METTPCRHQSCCASRITTTGRCFVTQQHLHLQIPLVARRRKLRVAR